MCSSTYAGVVLNVPSEIVPIPFSQTPYSLDLTFNLTAPTVSQALVGYDLCLTVAGGSGLSIIGVGTGSDRPANSVFSSDPAYGVETDPTAGTLYCFGDFSASGATITNGSALLRVKAQLQPGATGTYQITPFVNASGGQTTQFFSSVNSTGNATPITGLTFQSGTISVALPGDANLDGKVDINDLTAVLTNYGETAGATWNAGDFNGDGKVDINDLTAVLTNYGHSLGASAGGINTVPEPSSILALATVAPLVGWRLMRRRRHRRSQV
jgi:uncharacterized protein (DUF2141 family)